MDRIEEANAEDVIEALGFSPMPAALSVFNRMQIVVELCRKHRVDAGNAVLAGVWVGQGMEVPEIMARLFPKDRSRLSIVRG